ncbi:prephenate dehydratase [Nitrospira moscoviensis]|uniref:Bifunctional chorismate mutase/prephenate dehydratase n=1 Tax=Nitrospira moscoviensis TaxID=42253 RepID=A0A0K2G777_NITMO|nr:prephenate dehydratase [Nitrospira moscoviensis]ALA56790.1 P-protein, bifunctional chorismate mutase/prephenate dehydratase [Nitrospira moscoviensis]
MSKDLSDYRKEIDRIDDEILRLLNERSKSVIEIGKLKKERDAGANLHTPGREAAIIERLTKQNTGPFPTDAIQSVYREIMSASLSLEGPQKVAYLGPRATFTHMACMQKFGSSAQYVPVHSIKDVFSEVERGRANFGVVPIENTTEGVVNHTLDMFIDSNLLIYGEVLQEVSHHLLSTSGLLDDVKKIYSHPHAIAQCRNWLETNLPHVPVSEVASTARAAELCMDEPSSAAIASELAGQLYGLKVVKARIEDNLNNFTRFLVLSQKPPERTGKDKTSLMLSVKDKVGALYDLLRPFASHGLNMTKIESRPSRRKAWEYIFFVDVEGHIEEERVKKAVEEVTPRCLFLKILGSYPAHS